ncbi:hypothetical protein ACWT_6144 [Actinoplanes sp. SE50]|uniref:hypothetical protein n=1 Tax=unclassified Actinoplanes TaxID=2626549 RepID=UPI00023ECD58|nr:MULTISPECIES: hypothetical protein [unclassified Actinoplanes]AEV87161.1 hypothetical protein ACPL_6276 [Actinoplanes sp. SE50/110]ATO85559.1 hypothetical protein ACWT_6144 [Actinoplanes sp. SE50]SLM02972.1 hypothetical protein ACSP50_6257 [Actinoplanes sp. SE50/110]
MIADMWQQGEVPAFSGLYRADGTARAIEVDGAALSRFEVGEPFNPAERLAVDPDAVAEVDESARTAVPDGYIISGEGAHGSEGFFARLDAAGQLVWVLFLRNGNPFYEIVADGSRATFINNLGNAITIDLTDPLYA